MPEPETLQNVFERRAFRINEAAVVYRLSRSTIYNLIAAGKLRAVKIGGRRLIPRDAMEALLAQGATLSADDKSRPRG
jgi:excisionase family DNA binding protein